MFSNGQLIFAGFFVIAFVLVMVFSYKKDKKLHASNYKGVRWVGIVFVSFVIILFLIKYMLKN
ncbi:MAG: hypothetical protein AAFO99_00465 [Bacteroidota bacterium]